MLEEETVISYLGLDRYWVDTETYKGMINEIKDRKERRNGQTRETIFEDGDTGQSDCMALVVRNQW